MHGVSRAGETLVRCCVGGGGATAGGKRSVRQHFQGAAAAGGGPHACRGADENACAAALPCVSPVGEWRVELWLASCSRATDFVQGSCGESLWHGWELWLYQDFRSPSDVVNGYRLMYPPGVIVNGSAHNLPAISE